ncbi:dTDP-4-dehydrorhamnose reductase [Candidatus Roizmanbacteria bacterium]|nr:dTDP-4-dehydrorhamnose reductase [Candidatus Roizmanbacteria bacterium]
MRILIIGADGMLGGSLLAQLKKKDITLFAFSHTKKTRDLTPLEITDHEQVRNIVVSNKPDIIIHLAALTNVDYCESHEDEAFKVNYEATKNIVSICKKEDITLYFLSTGAVFSGEKKKPYIENDVCDPVNVYGKTKKKAEEEVRKLSSYCIIRTGWLIGGGDKDTKFVSLILSQLKNKTPLLRAVSDIYGSPTLTFDLATVIIKLIERKAQGTLHAVNRGMATRFDITKKILEILKSEVKLEPVPFGYFKENAKRPTMEALDSSKLKSQYHLSLPPWQVSLRTYIKSLI